MIQESMEKAVRTPKNYSIAMLCVFVLMLAFNLWHKSYFGFACVGFIFGLWLGFTMRWVLIK